MTLKKPDILDFFHELAHWMSKKQIHAKTCVTGSCSTVLQTYFRHAAADIDLWFSEVTDASGQLLNRSEVGELYDAFFAESKYSDKIDRAYNNMVHTEALLGVPNPSMILYMSIADAKGFGATIGLAPLEDIFFGKLTAWRARGVNQLILAIIPKGPLPPSVLEFFGGENPFEGLKVSKRKIARDDRDGYALGIILNERWPGPAPGRAATVTAQAKRGRRQITFQTIDL